MAPRIITPDQLADTQTSASYRINIDGVQFDFLTSYKKYSVSYLGNDVMRFELRDGDQFDWDVRSGMKSERSQIASKTLFANKEPVDLSFNFKLDPGSPNTANWLVLGQLHLAEWTGNLTGYSPPFEMGLAGEKMKLTVRYTGADGKPVAKVIYTDLKDIQRGHDYKIDVKAVFDPDGNGRLVVTRDGVVVADYSGPLGYQGQTKVLWGEGLYRDGAATETISAEFGNLAIKSGSAVTMPDKDIFIDAPKLAVDKVGAAGADGLRSVALSGIAKAGTSVTIFNGDTKLGVAKVDADGHFSLNVKVPKGAETALTTIATDSTGRNGLSSVPTYVEVGTGAEIGAKLQSLVAQGNIGSIVVTDGTVITVSSAIFSYIFKYGQDVLSKIQGNYSFYQTNVITGKTYDRQDFYYDAKGTLLQFVRYTKGVETYREISNADGSKHIIDKATAGQTSILDKTAAGLVTLSEQYDANNKLVIRVTKTESGASESHLFDTKTGLEFKYILKAADGSRVEGNLQLKGRPYASEVYTYDKAGTMVRQERYEADGTKIFLQKWNADGTREVHFYDGVTGKEINFTTTAADGSRVETTLKVGDPSQILKTISYDASGKVVAQTTGGTVSGAPAAETPVQPTKPVDAPVVTVPVVTSPVVTAPVVTAPKPADTPTAPKPSPATVTYAVDAKTGAKIGSTQVDADGTKTVAKFVAGKESLLLTKTVTGADGKLQLSETYDGAGTRTWSAVYAADGSHVNTQYGVKGGTYDTLTNVYDASETVVASTRLKAGKVVSETTTDADGSRLVKTYAANGTATVTDTGKDGKLLYSATLDAAGNKTALTVYGADGARVVTQYALKNATYDTLAKSYDAANKLVLTTQLKGDKLVMESKVAADGSTETHNYDLLGREIGSSEITANKVKDTFVFAYSGDTATVTRAQHDHYEGATKLWTDVTDAAGNHQQTSYSVGVTLVSHDKVSDTFVSGGRDTFVFAKGAGQDVIRNFTTAAATHDTIEIDHAGIHSFEQLHVEASGRDTVVTFGTSDSITLQNVAPSQLKADFFLFT